MKNYIYPGLHTERYILYYKTIILINLLLVISLTAFGQGSNCASAQTMTLNALTAQFSVNGSGDANSPDLSGSACTTNMINESWYQFNPVTGYTYITFQNSGDVTGYVYVYSGTCGSLSFISCNQALSSSVCLINLATVSGTVYYVRIIKSSAGTLSGRLGVYTNPGNSATLCLPDKDYQATGSADSYGGVYDGSLVVDCISAFGREMGWARMNTSNMPASGTYTAGSIGVQFFITCQSNYGAGRSRIVRSSGDPLISPYATSGNTNYFATTINGWGAGNTYAYNLNANAITDFTNNYSQNWWALCVVVNEASLWSVGVPATFYGYNDIFPPFLVVTYSEDNCVPPTITSQPQASITQCTGTKLTLNVGVDGTAPISYQWKKGSNLLANATNSTYSIASVSSGNSGSYICIINNACGSINSSAAVVTVSSGPVISSKSPDKIKCTRDSALFKVTVTGTPLPAFQWSKDGVDIDGSTTSSYCISQVLPGSTGLYSCKISNTCGNTSATISLFVDNTPFIQDTILNQTACEGSNISLSFHASGTNLKYQWSKIGGIIPGATTSILSFTDLKLSDANVYTCSISNSCDIKTLNPFILSINSKPGISITPLSQTKNPGDKITYTLLPSGLNLSYQWYKNSEILEGKTDNPFKIDSIICTDAGLYSVVISNTCGSVSAHVTTLIVPCITGYTISGHIKYDNTEQSAMTNTTVYLLNSNSERIASAITDVNGSYQFKNVIPGTYKLDCETTLPWGGGTPTDGLIIMKYFVGLGNIDDPLKLKAADVNLDGKYNSTDALVISKRFVTLISKFTAPDWIFENPTIIIDGADVQQDIKAICSGDCNGSNAW